MEGQLLNFLLAQAGSPLKSRSTRYGHLGRVPSLIPTRKPAEPRTETPSGITSTSLLTSGFPGLRERPGEEVLIQDPEVGRRMEKFLGGVATHCHLHSPLPEPALPLGGIQQCVLQGPM